MNDYALGAWETLNYAIRLIKRLDKDKALEKLEAIKEILEAAAATDVEIKLKVEAP